MEEMQCNIAVYLNKIMQEVRSPAPVRNISNLDTLRRPFARILESLLPKRKYRTVRVKFSSFTRMWYRTHAKFEISWNHTHTLHTPSWCVHGKYVIKTNHKQPSEIWVSGSGVHNDSCLCLVLPCQLVNSYRQQSIEDEEAKFLRNVCVSYITHYTAPDPRSIESTEKYIIYTQQ